MNWAAHTYHRQPHRFIHRIKASTPRTFKNLLRHIHAMNKYERWQVWVDGRYRRFLRRRDLDVELHGLACSGGDGDVHGGQGGRRLGRLGKGERKEAKAR